MFSVTACQVLTKHTRLCSIIVSCDLISQILLIRDMELIESSNFYFNFQAEEQLRIVEEQRKIHEERMKLEQERQRQQKEEQKIILGKGKSRPKLSFSLKTQD